MDLVALLIVTLLSALLALAFCLLLKCKLSPLAYVGAGLFGYFLGSWLFSELGVSDPLVLHAAGATFPVIAASVGILLVCLLARFVPQVR